MAIIKCSECGKEVSDQATSCIHCGCPIQKQSTQGKAIFHTSGDSIGLLAKYTIKDKDGNVVAKLKANDSFEIAISTDTTFYVRYSGGFTSFKEAFAPADCISRFSIGLSNGGCSFYINKV